ncbi:MAG: AI-2E family transporter, partial [Planctomycetota bacterium]
DDGYEQELLMEFDRISRAVVLATLLSAIAQGLTAGLGYAVAGMGFLALLIMLTTAFAMVPFVGPAVIWLPVCLYIGIYEERYLAAGLLALWGVLVVGTIDNLVKAVVLHGQSQLHPLLALLSVLGGVQALGPIGIVVGPMVVAMLQTLLGILQRELIHFDKQNLLLAPGGLAGGASGQGDNVAGREKVSKRKAKQSDKGESNPSLNSTDTEDTLKVPDNMEDPGTDEKDP